MTKITTSKTTALLSTQYSTHFSKSQFLAVITSMAILAGCGDRTPSNRSDRTAPVITLTAPVGGEEARDGNFEISWTTDDPNPRTVEILLSPNSGTDFPIVIAEAAADTGSFTWDSSTVPDGGSYRIQITPTDVPGNVGSSAVSPANFIVNNTPKVEGLARYTDENINGISDFGDLIIVPFDRDITANNTTANSFVLTSPGNRFGDGAAVSSGPGTNEVTITLGNNASFKTRQRFNPFFLINAPNNPSGIDISTDIGQGAIVATLSGVTADNSRPLDIVPGHVNAGQSLGNSNSMDVVLFDIDKNGSMDLVSANDGQGNTVWTNDGSGTFTDSGQSLGTNNSMAIAYGDVDKDGDPDIVVANNGQANKVWSNDANGTFSDAAQDMGANNTLAIALGDVDKDGDLDIITGNNGQANRIWSNSNATPGTFTDSGQTLGSGNTTAIVLGDVDNDGDLDIVSGNNGQANRVWLNNDATPGIFNDSGQLLGSNDTTALALGDIDNDGDLDLVEGNNNQGNLVWLNDGSGVFSDSGRTLGNNQTSSIQLYDIDSDGKLDIIEGNSNQGNSVWINAGSGVFNDSLQSLGNNDTRALAVADIDKDGDVDIATANASATANQLWLGSLQGTWGTVEFVQSAAFGGNSSTKSITLGDIDNDGDLDLVTGSRTDTPTGLPNQVLKNDGNGVFTVSQALGTATTQEVRLRDFDQDGDLDLVAANIAETSLTWINTGNGNYVPGQDLITNPATLARSVGFADADLDGDIDIFFGNGTDNLIFANTNNVFTDSVQVPALDGFNSRQIEVVDVNHDGYSDMISCNALGAASIYTNNPGVPGTYTDTTQALNNTAVGAASTTCFSVNIGDFNSDGSPDIVFGNGVVGNGSPNEVWLNDGTGVYLLSQSLGLNQTTEVVSGDIDGDGDIDIVASNRGGQGNTTWINNGNGVFSLGDILGGNDSRSIVLGDVDNDGDLDIIEGVEAQGNRIWFNQ